MLVLESTRNSIISNVLSFGSQKKEKPKADSSKLSQQNLPTIENELNIKKHPVKLPGVSFDLASKIINYANKTEMTVNDYLLKYLKHFTPKDIPEPQPMVTANIGKTKVTTLIDGEQIFDKTIEYLEGAKESIQVEMFEFQNQKVDGDIWPSKGAETVPGWEEQQKILDILIDKKAKNPDMKVQVLLDVHKWYMDGNGEYKRHYNNSKMMKHLLDHNIDVLPYPRAAQQGAVLQHVKLLAVDSKKVIIGGMNWGTHSSANHDVCVAIEPKDKRYKNTEVDNIIEEIFNKDWRFALQRISKTKPVSGPLTPAEQSNYTRLNKKIKQENVDYMNTVGYLLKTPQFKDRYGNDDIRLPNVYPIEKPAIRVLTNKPRELSFIQEEGQETIGKYLKNKIKTADKLNAELFVLSHKEIVNTIIKRYKDPKDKFDVKILIAPDILEAFPYTRKFHQQLVDAGVPIREYKCEDSIDQRLHTKLGIFQEKGVKSVILGSANWSAVGLEQNVQKGQREDYYLTIQYIDKEIGKYLKDVEPFENKIKIEPIQKKYSLAKLRERKKVFKKALKELKQDGSAKIKANKNADIKQDIMLDDKQTKTISDIYGYYGLIDDFNNRKEKFKRGNNEAAIVFDSTKIANNFLRQFDKDWKHSEPHYENLVSKLSDKEEKQSTAIRELAQKSKMQIKSPPKTNFENNIILQVKDKKYQGGGLYTDKGFIDWKKVGWEHLKEEPFDWKEKNKEQLNKNIQAYWHALSLAETNDTSWVRRYNKYNVLKPLATNHTLSGKEARNSYRQNLQKIVEHSKDKELKQPIMDKNGKLLIDFTVFDFESTGVSAKMDKIVQIGAIKIKKGEIQPELSLNQLVNPERHIPDGASKVHRIYDKHVKNAPKSDEVLKEFSNKYLGNDILVAYNSKYDMTMLNSHIKRYNSKNQNKIQEKETYKVLDPFIMLQRIHPYLGAKKTLSHQYKFIFGQDLEGAHNAVDDVKATVDVLKYCVNYLNDKRKDKSVPLSVRDVLLFQNGVKPKNLNFNFDASKANADVNFDASYRKISLSVDNYFDGYKLSKTALNEIKNDIGDENYVALGNGEVVGELVNLVSHGHPINPGETLKEITTKQGAISAPKFVMKKNYKEMLDLVGVKGYKNKSKEEIIDLITKKSEHFIKEEPTKVWVKNPKLYDTKEGNDLPDVQISQKVMLEKIEEEKRTGTIESKSLKDIP